MTHLTIWRDGAFEDHPLERCAQFASGMHYGVGVFEGIRSYATPRGTAIFRMDEHLDRMEQGGEALNMFVDTEAIAEAAFELLRRSGHRNTYIRPMAWWGGGRMQTILPTMPSKQVIMAIPWEAPQTADRGAHVTTHAWRREDDTPFHTLKLSGSYQNAYLDKRRARERGFDSVIYVDGEHVVRGSSENVFAVFGDEIVSVVHPEAMDGVTRRSLVAMTGAEERSVTITELAQADEIFLVGTSAEVTPVVRFDDRVVPYGPVTRQVRTAYLDIVHGHDASRQHWLTYVPGASTTYARSAK